MTSDTSLPPPSAQTKLQAHTSAVVINTRLIKIVLVHNLVIKVFLKQTWCFYSYSHDKTVYNMLFKTTCTEHRVYNTGTIIPDGTKNSFHSSVISNHFHESEGLQYVHVILFIIRVTQLDILSVCP